MFKKKPQIKTLSPLRSSDRRKLADKIILDYGLQAPASASQGEDAQAEQVAAHSSLRKSLLPDNALSAKFITTTGPELREVVGTVYVGGHSANEQRVLWIRIDETIYPSVYTLWHNPRTLPLLHTPSMVIEKLKGGADLMTPGLAGPPFPPKASKGAIVAIASLDSPTVPVVVGTCLIDVNALENPQGGKGHAVETFHWAGDELWDWSSSGRSGASIPSEVPGWAEIPGWVVIEDDEISKAAGRLAVADEDDLDGGVSLKVDDAEETRLTSTGGIDRDGLGEVVEGGAASGMTPKEIDDTFWNAFLYGVYQHKRDHPHEPKFGLDFPLNQSVFASSLVNPFLPIHTPEDAQVLQMKKTSWKNTRKFIKALDKTKLLLSKEGKNEAMVLDIDFDDQQFTNFQPYRLPKKEAGATTSGVAGEMANDSVDDSIGQTIKVLNLYRPKDSIMPLFNAPNAPRLSYYHAADVRTSVTEYVESSGLVDQTNKRQVKLDPVISNAVLSGDSRIDRDLLAKGSMPRDALIDRVTALCALSHVILRNGEKFDASKTKPKAGGAPKVGILLETRGGNKTVTRVFGLEPFSVKVQPLADELRKACASSTSVEPFKGGKGLEVMVQGPQTDAVTKALARRGIAKQWTELTDKTKGKKK